MWNWHPEPGAAYSNLGIWTDSGVTDKAHAAFIAATANAAPDMAAKLLAIEKMCRDAIAADERQVAMVMGSGWTAEHPRDPKISVSELLAILGEW